MPAQGATEYLVLLAVVLIIALVGTALLGFFPGTATDAQMTESRLYWQSASPIAITEWTAGVWIPSGETYPYLRIRNAGVYPIRITGVIGGDGGKATMFVAGESGCTPPLPWTSYNMADYFYMAPGEEKYFGWPGSAPGLTCQRQLIFIRSGATSGYAVGGSTSFCQNSTASPGYFETKNFGFEYIQYVEGQQLTKRQIGAKPVIIKCSPPA